MPADLVREIDGQTWTSTKLLRRLARYERGELAVMRASPSAAGRRSLSRSRPLPAACCSLGPAPTRSPGAATDELAQSRRYVPVSGAEGAPPARTSVVDTS